MKFKLPDFLEDIITHEKYNDWLYKKASSLFSRDKKRSEILDEKYSLKQYRKLINDAVVSSKGKDFYTGLILQWKLIGQYNNQKSNKRGVLYKRKFDDLPTIDHEDGITGEIVFNVCSWKINDCKSNLSYAEFVEVCELILKHKK